MNDPHYCHATQTKRRQHTADLGYAGFRCQGCDRLFKERTGIPFNSLEGSTDKIFPTRFCRVQDQFRIKIQKMAALFAVFTFVVFCPNLYAGIDEEQAVLMMLDAAYGPYDSTAKRWVTEYDGLMYEFRILDKRKISAPKEERIYVLTGGDAKENGDVGHPTPGLIGAFIGVENGNSIQVIASAKALPFGGYGMAPESFEFKQFGPDYYFGWIIDSGYTATGHTCITKTILLPYGKKVSDRGTLATCDKEFSVTVDNHATGVKVFPLIVKLKQEGKPRKLREKTIVVLFDEKAFKYRVPKALSSGC